ncbi:MAG: copper amine oxidase N-terminal domain-containing protein [Firmicutes bacterium]|nr:copper amine oxidase N-terminal domain-containing protein [Bacillota bacterium]
MVPLRFISETLDAEVNWDKDTRTVYIWTGAVEKVPVKPEVVSGITPYEGAKPTNPKEWKTADGFPCICLSFTPPFHWLFWRKVLLVGIFLDGFDIMACFTGNCS